jgi:hypothetical protein
MVATSQGKYFRIQNLLSGVVQPLKLITNDLGHWSLVQQVSLEATLLTYWVTRALRLTVGTDQEPNRRGNAPNLV